MRTYKIIQTMTIHRRRTIRASVRVKRASVRVKRASVRCKKPSTEATNSSSRIRLCGKNRVTKLYSKVMMILRSKALNMPKPSLTPISPSFMATQSMVILNSNNIRKQDTIAEAVIGRASAEVVTSHHPKCNITSNQVPNKHQSKAIS